MAVVESQVAATELERVRPKVVTVFERQDKFYSRVAKRGDVEKVSNRQMRAPLELRPGGSFQYWNPDGGDLGRGGGPTFDKALISCVFMSENIEYTKLTQYSTDDPRKAVQNAVRKLTATALDEMRRQLEGQCQQSGNGVLGTLSAVSTTSGVDTYTLNTDGFGAKLIRYGQTVQLYDTTLATLRGSGVVSMHDVENKQISVTPAISGAIATDKIVVAGISSPSSLPALLGVPYHHNGDSSGTWLGFTRSTTPEIRSNRVNASGASLDLPMPRLAMNKITNRMGDDFAAKPTAWMHPCQKQAYEEIGQLVSVIQKMAKEEGLDMYFDRMQMAGAPVEASNMWNQKRIDFVNSAVWARAEILPIGFYTTDGRRIFEIRGASGGVAAAEIFYMVVGMQTFVTNPAATAYIDDLAVPSGY